MKQLKDFIPHQPDVRTYAEGASLPNHTLVGIEVELERYKHRREEGRLVYWRSEGDGSLREGGIEFVLNQPLTGIDLEKAIAELRDKILNTKYEVNRRCSTHVHIDARDMTVEHLRAMVFVYTMVERMLYDLVTPDREDSFYCTPLYRSSLHRKQFARALDRLNFNECPRYSGLNMRSLQEYGSLEFRMHNGLEDANSLEKWIQVLLQLKAGTRQFEHITPKNLLERYSQNSAESIIRSVFGPLAEELLAGKNYNRRLKNSMRSAQDLLLLLPDNRKTLSQKEREWLKVLNGDKCLDTDIDPELLEILRNKRDEILGN